MLRLTIAVFCFTLTTTPAAELYWGPYLQDVRPGRATVLWTTTGWAASGAVRYFSSAGPIDVPSTAAALPATVTGLEQDIWLHRAQLVALEPATTYRYVVRLDGATVAEDPTQRFTTAGPAPFRFLAVGDTGDNGSGQRQLAQTLLRESAAFLLHTGDIAYWDGTFDQFRQAYFGIYDTLLRRMAVFPTLGNHDALADALAYRTLFAPPQDGVPLSARNRYYSFNWANAHFTVLDSNQPLTPNSPMLAWLEQDLRETKQTWRIVAIHHPPFPSTPYKRDDPICKEVLNLLAPVFERYGVHLVLSGHEHIYQRTQPRRDGDWMPQGPGAVYITTGGGGSQFYEAGAEPFLSASASGPHFLRITITESTLQGEAVNLAGEPFDQWQLSAAPQLVPDAVRDAASFGKQLAPGGLVSILGWNLDNATVRDANRSWPVLYSGRTQLNAQVPFETQDRATLAITSRHGAATATVPVGISAPNIFLIADAGRQTAAAIHLDGRLVSKRNPASPGEWISVYATGLGRVNGQIATGAPAPVTPLLETLSPVQAHLDGRAMDVSAACLAPGFVGLYQINIRVPGGLPPGTYPLQLRTGGQPGNLAMLDIGAP